MLLLFLEWLQPTVTVQFLQYRKDLLTNSSSSFEHVRLDPTLLLLVVVLSMFFVVLSNGILIKIEVVTHLKALCRNMCG